jgi:hypothetical protein
VKLICGRGFLFLEHHGYGLSEDKDNISQVRLCRNCHFDLSKDKEKLHLARTLSPRNGFGRIDHRHLDDMVIAGELKTLLDSLTIAEDLAIQQIMPLMTIVRLKHRNIASKGNVTCVWQESRLNSILPNLPQQCATIVIERSKKIGDQLVALASCHCKHWKIERVLRLLNVTRH